MIHREPLVKHHEPQVKHHETLLKHWETSFDATMSVLDVETLALDAETLALVAATSAIALIYRRYRRRVFCDCGVGITLRRCVTELLIMEIWVLFPNLVNHPLLRGVADERLYADLQLGRAWPVCKVC